MFKKEDEKDREVRGGEALSSGTYAVNTRATEKRANELARVVVTSTLPTGQGTLRQRYIARRKSVFLFQGRGRFLVEGPLSMCHFRRTF